MNAWSEDRALVRTNSSAVPSGKPKVGGAVAYRHSSLRFFHQAKNLSGRMPERPARCRHTVELAGARVPFSVEPGIFTPSSNRK